MVYNCLVADDFDVQRNLLSKYIAKIANLKLAGMCEDGIEAAAIIAKGDIDIVFCDIDMPNLSGIGLLRSLKNPPVFIYISGHSKYAVESYDLEVADFILKPVMFERFSKAVNKAMRQVDDKYKSNLKTSSGAIESVSVETDRDDHFFIKESHGITRLKYDDVLYIESLGNFSKIHTITDHKHILLSNLKSLESKLPRFKFIRVHKYYIANLHNVLTVTPNEIHFINKQAIKTGVGYRQLLMKIFMNKEVIKRDVNP